MLSTTPIPIAIRIGNDGWEILTPLGPQAQLLHRLSGNMATGIPIEKVDGSAMAVIPYTGTLDTALETLVDTLISLRYATGRVQLELFAVEEV